MSNRAQDVLVDVLLGDLPGVCSSVEAVREAPSLQCAWEGDLHPWLWLWFIDTFIDDANERARIYRGMSAVRSVFLQRAKRHFEKTGKATLLDDELITELQIGVANALRPSAYEIATGATKQPAARASANLRRLTKETAWLTKSAS